MSNNIALKIDKLLEAINKMYKENDLDESSYNKMIMSLSYEYASNMMFEDAYILLGTINSHYFENNLLFHLKDDPAFYDLCNKYIDLINLNLNLSSTLLPNCPPAKS